MKESPRDEQEGAYQTVLRAHRALKAKGYGPMKEHCDSCTKGLCVTGRNFEECLAGLWGCPVELIKELYSLK